MLKLSIKEQKKILGGNYWELMIIDPNGNVKGISYYGTEEQLDSALALLGKVEGYEYRKILVITD